MRNAPLPDPGNIAVCHVCGVYGRRSEMDTIDLSREDEYYPVIRYLCRDHVEEDDV